jgi:DNA-directed RNA polymerase subunit RPC12/RpoP
MARTKYSEHFCSYCNKTTKMELGGEMNGLENRSWFRCTRCHHTTLIELKPQADTKVGARIDATTATTYTPLQSFKIGEAIFHAEWNDLGKVVQKTKTSDGSQAILVSFEKGGQRRLIENLKPEPTVEVASKL